MEARFAGCEHFYGLDEAGEKELLENAWVVFDTSAMFDLYRGVISVTEEALPVIEAVKDRLWMPHQVAREYYANFREVKSTLFSSEQEVLKSVRISLEALRGGLGSHRNPLLTSALYDMVQNLESETAKLKSNKDLAGAENMRKHVDRISAFLQVNFTNVGVEFPQVELTAIHDAARERIENKLPPGATDAKKPIPQRYGDFIIWKQMLMQASSTQKPVLFITSELKADWWWKDDKQNIIGPHQALRKEMKDESGQGFWIYGLEDFGKRGTELLLKKKPSPKADRDSEATKKAASAAARISSLWDLDKSALAAIGRISASPEWERVAALYGFDNNRFKNDPLNLLGLQSKTATDYFTSLSLTHEQLKALNERVAGLAFPYSFAASNIGATPGLLSPGPLSLTGSPEDALPAETSSFAALPNKAEKPKD